MAQDSEDSSTLGKTTDEEPVIPFSPEDLSHNHVFEDARGQQLKVLKYGYIYYPPFGEGALSNIRDLDIRNDDICLVGYPKTGTSWLFELVAMLIDPVGKAEKFIKVHSFLELTRTKVVNAIPSPRILNTHLRYDQLPKQIHSKKTKLILSVRNPKDVLVSFFHHHKKLIPLYGWDGEFEDFFQLFIKGEVDYECYFDYQKDWDRVLREHSDQEILIVSYEDMKEDLTRELRRLATFLELQVSDDVISSIVARGQFDSMAKSGKLAPHIPRKGEVGDWKNWLTVAQNDVIDGLIAKKMPDVSFYAPKYTLK